MTITRRILSVDDAPAVVALLDELEAREPAGLHFDTAEIREYLTGPGNDLALGSVAWERDGELVACGLLDISPVSDRWKAVLLGGVRVAEQRHGLGRRIVDELAGAAARLRDRDAAGRPGELLLWVPQGRDSVVRLAEATGFTPWRYYFDMSIALDGPLPAVTPIDGLQVRPWSPEVDESTRQASNAAFADHYGSVPSDPERWRHHHAGSSSFRPALSRVALDGSTVVAFVLVQEFAAETAQRGYRTGYIARVGTLRPVRGRGVAGALLAETLQALRADGCQVAELGVDAASPTGAGRLYERLGFRQIRRNTLMGRSF